LSTPVSPTDHKQLLLQAIPRWLIALLLLAIAGMMGFGIYDNRQVDFYPPKIYPRPVYPSSLPSRPSSEPQASRRIVFVDTTVREHVYEPKSISNADFLIEHLNSDPVLRRDLDPRTQLVEETLPQATAVAKLLPHGGLVIIHRSAFETQRDRLTPEEKLESFLRGLTDTEAVFLVYSRKPQTDGKFAVEVANAAALKNRVFAYQFRGPRPFGDPSVVDHFLATARMLAHAEARRSVE